MPNCGSFGGKSPCWTDWFSHVWGILTDCIAATDQTVIAESWKHHYNGIQRLLEPDDDH
jgi:hypothetical protein